MTTKVDGNNQNSDNNGMFMKRTNSEKSLTNSTGITCSSSSSASSSTIPGPRRQKSAPLLVVGSASSIESLKSSSASSIHSQHSSNLVQKPSGNGNVPSTKSVTWSLERNSVEIIDYSDNRADIECDDGSLTGSNFESRFKISHEETAPDAQTTQLAQQPVEFAIATLTGTERRLRVLQTRRFDDGHFDKLLEDGTLLTIFSNGTVKETR